MILATVQLEVQCIVECLQSFEHFRCHGHLTDDDYFIVYLWSSLQRNIKSDFGCTTLGVFLNCNIMPLLSNLLLSREVYLLQY